MVEQNKLEAFSGQPPPHIDPHHAINIPDTITLPANSASSPTHGHPPGQKDFSSIVLYPSPSYSYKLQVVFINTFEE
ncbi:hypothetical protein L195_g061541, partial [Trifolium pratense]